MTQALLMAFMFAECKHEATKTEKKQTTEQTTEGTETANESESK